MTTIRFSSVATAVALVAAAGAAPAARLAGQSLAQRVAAAPDGTLRFDFALRPDVCADGESVRSEHGSADWEPSCDDGPGRVVLDVADHRVTALRFYVGGRWRPGAATDLGRVPAAQAAAFLLDLAGHTAAHVAEHAIAPAALADSVVVWRRLLELARDTGRPGAVRRRATFWLSQQAASAATRGLAELAVSDGDREVRRAAVFALSQRPPDEGVPALMHIARASRDPQMRRQAIFWLGQTRDPRALDFLRAVLAGS